MLWPVILSRRQTGSILRPLSRTCTKVSLQFGGRKLLYFIWLVWNKHMYNDMLLDIEMRESEIPSIGLVGVQCASSWEYILSTSFHVCLCLYVCFTSGLFDIMHSSCTNTRQADIWLYKSFLVWSLRLWCTEYSLSPFNGNGLSASLAFSHGHEYSTTIPCNGNFNMKGLWQVFSAPHFGKKRFANVLITTTATLLIESMAYSKTPSVFQC